MSDWSFTNRVMPHSNCKTTFHKIEYLLTQSKMLLMARCTLNLYECVLSISNADFRLYEFLKNSRSGNRQQIDARSILKQANFFHLLVLKLI